MNNKAGSPSIQTGNSVRYLCMHSILWQKIQGFLIIVCFLLYGFPILGQGIAGINMERDVKIKLIGGLAETKKGADLEVLDIDKIYAAFFPFHLNSDEKVDFIYNGPASGESYIVEIYLSINGVYELMKSETGIVSKVVRPLPDSPTLIYFNQYGCCDDPLNYFQIWTINGSSITESEKYYHLNETDIPDELNFQFIIEVQNSPYTLRATPEIIDEDFHYHYKKGNIIAEFSKGDTGYVLNSKPDQTGRVWYFVIMDPPKITGFHNYGIYRDEKWLGWMSGRYVNMRE